MHPAVEQNMNIHLKHFDQADKFKENAGQTTSSKSIPVYSIVFRIQHRDKPTIFESCVLLLQGLQLGDKAN